MSGSSPKQLEANWRNAQHSTGPPTLTDSVAAISDRGSLTIELKAFGVLEVTLVEKIAVAHCRQSCVLPSSLNIFKIVRYQNAIERQLHRATTQLQRLQVYRCLSNLQPPETSPIDQN